MSEDRKQNFFWQIVNFISALSIPIGIAVGTMLISMKSDIEVIKSQIIENQKLYQQFNELKNETVRLTIELERVKAHGESNANDKTN